MMKKKRQDKIVELIENNSLTTQEELSELLKRNGYKVTQATISRDIRELRLTKVNVDGKQRYVALKENEKDMNDRYIRVLKEGFVSMCTAHGFLVLKTVSGMAMAVAAAVDSIKIREIAGCIAGDDTIFIAIKTDEAADTVMERIDELVTG